MHGTQSASAEWQLPSSPSRGPQGTPLGRIVAGVFLGLLAWTVVMGVIGFILLSVVSNGSDDINDLAPIFDSSSLSAQCEANLQKFAGHELDLIPPDCEGDSLGAVIGRIGELDIDYQP